jgi:hydrogenase maturation protease
VAKTLIFGAGNLLLSDEGFGVHFVRYLQEHYRFPPEIELLDAGTLGLMVGHYLEQAQRVYLIDAVAAEGEPGTLLRYAKSEFFSGRLPLKLSPHQVGVQEMLLVAELRGLCPSEITLFGVIPASLEPGTELTPRIRERMAELAEKLVAELEATGLRVTRLCAS